MVKLLNESCLIHSRAAASAQSLRKAETEPKQRRVSTVQYIVKVRTLLTVM